MIAAFDLARRARREPEPRRSVVADVNSANVAAGLTAVLFYVFAAAPVFQSGVTAMGLNPAQASSSFFIVFFTAAFTGILLTLRFRQPMPMGWTLPGLMFLANVGHRYTLPELAGACLVTGLGIFVIGMLGLGERLLRWLPLPIVLGMFAGTALSYATGIFAHFETEPTVVGATIGGYLAARMLDRGWLPPVAGAFLAGLATAAVTGRIDTGAFTWQAPEVVLVRPAFDPASMLAVSLPLLVIALGMGHVQGIGYLVSQGFRPPVKLMTMTLGLSTLVNAVFGGHVATIQNNGAAILGGPDAGPRGSRYVANLIAASCALVIALGAATVSSVLGLMPPGLVPAMAGLAILTALIDAFKKVATAALPMGAFFAFIIAASPLTLFGIGSAVWALAGGLAVTLVLERPELARAVAAPGDQHGSGGAAATDVPVLR